MKQNKYLRRVGPFRVYSVSQDGHGVRLEVYPAFPQYNISPKRRQSKDVSEEWKQEPRWAIRRLLLGNGGGPGIFTAIATAKELEDFLNQPYSKQEVDAWRATLKEALSEVVKKDLKRFEKTMDKREREKKP